MKNNKIHSLLTGLFFLLLSCPAKAQENGSTNESTGGDIALMLVFLVLASTLIYIALKDFGYLDKFKNRKTRTEGENNPAETKSGATDFDYAAEDENMAAIAVAIHLYATQMHDEESEVITFEDFARPYSPWSQKHLLFKNRLHGIKRRK